MKPLLFTGEQGATRQAITKAQLENFVVKYPPLPDQHRIVATLDELKKSILDKEFKGEL